MTDKSPTPKSRWISNSRPIRSTWPTYTYPDRTPLGAGIKAKREQDAKKSK